MPLPNSSLADVLDEYLAPSGAIAVAVLIDPDVSTATISSINTSTEVITTTANHGWVDGTRVRMSVTGGALPTGISSSTDYYVDSLSSTTLSLYPTLADCLAGTNKIGFSDTGTGVLTLTEQALSGGLNADTFVDRKEVILNHEVSHADYTARFSITDIGAASQSTAEKPVYLFSQAVSGGEPTLEVGYILILKGGSTTLGDTTGTIAGFRKAAATVSITAGSSKTFNLNYSAVNGSV